MFAGKMCSTEVGLLDAQAEFTWGFGEEFFVEVDDGTHYIWSSPMYGGDNSFIATQLSYDQWIERNYGRDKGHHRIRDYCGPDIKIIAG